MPAAVSGMSDLLYLYLGITGSRVRQLTTYVRYQVRYGKARRITYLLVPEVHV